MASTKFLNLNSFFSFSIFTTHNSIQKHFLVYLFLNFLFSSLSFAAGGVGETQSRRSSERFNILDWIRAQQSAVRAQDSKWGRGGSAGGGPYIDISFLYFQEAGAVKRDATSLGTDARAGGKVQFYLDDLFTQGNKSRLLNIDLGLEASYTQSTFFTKETVATQNIHNYKELSGAFLIRPLGRSSQDTSFAVKAGYLSVDEAGLWNTSSTLQSLYALYLGADAKLYLLPFLGLNAQYENALETSIGALSGNWKMQRFRYGAFLEIYLLNIGAHLFTTEYVLSQNSGAVIKETTSGVGFSGILYF